MAEAPPAPADALTRALALFRAGDLDKALPLVEGALQSSPASFDALHLMGLIEARRGRLAQAERAIARAIAVNPGFAPAHLNRAQALAGLGRTADAVASYDRALALKPDNAEAQFRRANLLRGLGRIGEALQGFERAVAIDPRHAEAWNNRGVMLKALGRFGDARACYARALEAKPDFSEAAGNLGNLLVELRRPEEALAHFDRALALKPDDAQALSNRGNAQALLDRYDAAIADYERAVAIDPDQGYTRGALLHLRMRRCDWRGFPEAVAALTRDVRSGKRAVYPFPFLAMSDAAEDQLRCCRIVVRDKCPAAPARRPGRGKRRDKIRVAYLSADFHDHPTAYLTAGLFELHDRDRFETAALSCGADSQSPMRARLQSAFSRFIDVGNKTDSEVARLIRELEIDIAVDLMGFTRDFRSGLLAARPAPVQVNYLGYPGTMGAGFIDYIIADRFMIPEKKRADYAEQVVYMPDCFQANDAKRPRVAAAPARAALGLPETGIVFCAFSNSYKITPAVFDIWMRLLARVEGSVLWLLADIPAVRGNLEREAAARGVAPGRLISAPRLGYAEYLARYAAADMFLDTLPFNAGATASDALWAGLPVVTCPGGAFAARMAGSLLTAVGLPELIADSPGEYEALALKLASDPGILSALKTKLAANRAKSPLFDTKSFTRNLEAAYQAMWDRHCRGLPPAPIDLSERDSRP